MTGILNDLRFAARRLRRSPSFSVVAMLTLALGIGANTAVFSLVDGVLFKSLTYVEPEELVALSHSVRDGQDPLQVSRGLYLLYVEKARTLSDIALHQQVSLNLVGDGEPERIDGYAVTPGFSETLGVRPVVGRTFTAEEGQPDAEQVVILSDGLWRRRFGADPSIPVIASLLYGVSALDPFTYGGVAVALASWLPAQRASRVDPLTALKNDSALAGG